MAHTAQELACAKRKAVLIARAIQGHRMFFRIKPSGERRYRQIVENTRDGASTRQRVLATLGRVEDLEADGRLDALLRSGARFSDTALLISSLRRGRSKPAHPCVSAHR